VVLSVLETNWLATVAGIGCVVANGAMLFSNLEKSQRSEPVKSNWTSEKTPAVAAETERFDDLNTPLDSDVGVSHTKQLAAGF
jgi:hypothetical protein